MKDIIHIYGMHCKSCEVLLENKISQVKGIGKVKASNKKGTIEIHSKDGYEKEVVLEKITEAGYKIDPVDIPMVRLIGNDKRDILISLIIIFILIVIFNNTNLFKRISQSLTGGTDFFTISLVGLVAGFSTCMALVGGLVLGISARFSEKHPETKTISKFKPHIFFNAGRIISFFILGGFIGAIGSFLQFSNFITGLLIIAAGVFMFFLGIKILEIFPRFNNGLVAPKFISKYLGYNFQKSKEYSHLNSFILGGLTFFLPCGFTQAMQVLAISTGSFWQGSLIMGAFSLGTLPGLLGIGWLTSWFSKNNLFFKFTGILVILLSLVNISNGLNISGIKSWASSVGNSLSQLFYKETPERIDTFSDPNTLVLEAVYDPDDYYKPIKPDYFEVFVNQPVRIEIYAKGDGQGCMGSVMIPRLVNKPQYFIKNKKVILEFKAKSRGEYLVTCAMGVIAGKINVK